MTATAPSLKDVEVQLHAEGYATLALSRPRQSNAFSLDMLQEISQAARWLSQQSDARAVILQGRGQNFCAGIDLRSLGSIAELLKMEDRAAAASSFRQIVLGMQDAFTALEECRWPVIAAVQGACIGGGLDLIAACDVRYCSSNACFSLKEVDLAITADLGSLQRLPSLIGHGRTMELALTARTLSADEAYSSGLVSRVFADRETLDREAVTLAQLLAKKPAVALAGTKRVLLHARDNSIASGLEYVATWNAGHALSNDLKKVMKPKKQAAGASSLHSKL